MLIYACKTHTPPCPVPDQYWVETATITDLADFGITPEAIGTVIFFGFGVVLLGFLLGYVLGLALGLIKKA